MTTWSFQSSTPQWPTKIISLSELVRSKISKLAWNFKGKIRPPKKRVTKIPHGNPRLTRTTREHGKRRWPKSAHLFRLRDSHFSPRCRLWETGNVAFLRWQPEGSEWSYRTPLKKGQTVHWNQNRLRGINIYICISPPKNVLLMAKCREKGGIDSKRFEILFFFWHLEWTHFDVR